MANTNKNNPSSNTSDVFDARKVRRLVELMQENELTELNIQQGDTKIHLKREGMAAVSPAFGPQMVYTPPIPTSLQQVAVPENKPAEEEKNTYIIKSPMVGTFYAAPNPESSPFVKIGDSVSLEKTVCLIEAMKVYNEIQAECNGKIIAILAKNGETVEFGSPLFKVRVE